MRKTAIFLVAAAIIGTVIGFSPAHATTTCLDPNASASVDVANEANPQLVDDAGDYNGLIGGNTMGTPEGDIYGASNDLLKAWISRDATTLKYQVGIDVGKLDGIETNAIYYFRWVFPSGLERFVSAEITRPGGASPLPAPTASFEYGHLDTSGAVPNLVTDGRTTGTMTLGAPGLIRIDVPMTRMGNPPSGSTLTGITAEARFLAGTPATGGLVFVEDMTDGFPCNAADIP